MRKSTRRNISGFLCFLLCFSLNINPLATVSTAFIESEFFGDCSIAVQNIAYWLSDDFTGIVNATAIPDESEEESASESVQVDVTIDNSEVVDSITGLEQSVLDAITSLEQNVISTGTAAQTTINNNGTKITSSVTNLENTIHSDLGQINEDLIKKTDEIIKNENDNTSQIVDAIEQAQHRYKVANIYSINNQESACLWRPSYSELPYLDAAAYYSVGYAAVYNGYWDLQNTTISKPQSEVTRALEILGYDALVRNEGYIVNGGTGTYIQTLIDEDAVTWSDAVQVIYKALDQEVYSYSYYTQADSSIVPEKSPLSQTLSNVTTFDNSEGKYMFFISRSNQYTTKDMTGTKNVYWEKAMTDGLVKRDNEKEQISGSEFFILSAAMMQLYGEPVYSQTETDQLLQVYGSEYPIQLGTQIADAWSYLKARGILNVDIEFTGYVSRDNLMEVAMCIKDEESRTNFKEISLTMELSDAMISNGFYPVKDLAYATGTFGMTEELDYTKCSYYDYLIQITDTSYGTNNNGNAVTSTFKDASGANCFTMFVSAEENNYTAGQLSDSQYVGTWTDKEGISYYHFRVPKGHTASISINSTNAKDSPAWITIPKDHIGGGVYTSFKIGTDAQGGSGLYTTPEGYKTFSSMSTDESNTEWLSYVDWERAKGSKPTSSIVSKISSLWEYLTTPIVAEAATIKKETGTTVTIKFNAEDGDYATTGPNAGECSAFNLIRSYDVFLNSGLVEALKNSSTQDDAQFTKDIRNAVSYGFNGNYGTTIYFSGIKDYYKSKSGQTSDLMSVIMMKSKYNFSSSSTVGIWYPSSADKKGWLVGAEVTVPAVLKRSIETRITNGIYNLVNTYSSNFHKLYNLAGVTNISLVSSTNGYTYKITTSDKNALYDILGSMGTRVKNAEGDEVVSGVVSTSSSSSSEDLYSGSASLASSAIMDRNQNILISWGDLKKSGFVHDTFNGKMPTPDETDGIYYIQTTQGVTKINPTTGVIVIGTVMYNLQGLDGSVPTLIYIDTDKQELYLDYRAIMGIATVQFQKTSDTVVTSSNNSIGSGTSVIYTLSSTGTGNSLMTTIDYSSYNYPDSPTASSAGSPYGTYVITETTYDGEQYSSSQQINSVAEEYWSSTQKESMLRIPLASFCPTANWLTVIKDDGAQREGKLFVWYPRQAFINNNMGKAIEDSVKPTSGYDAQSWESASQYGSSLYSLVGSSMSSRSDEWYDEMTKQSVYELYNMTNGGTYISADYVVRSYDLLNNSIVSSDDLSATGLYGNQPYACYWIEGIGFVYNMPNKTSYSHESYLSGKIKLPIAFTDSKTSNVSHACIYNYNIDYYSEIFKKDDTVSGSYKGYGYVLGEGVFNVFNAQDEKDGHIGDPSSLRGGSQSSSIQYKNTDSLDITADFDAEYPYNISDSSAFAYSPAGVFCYFGGTKMDYVKASDLSGNMTAENYVFLGGLRLSYDTNSKGSDKLYYRGSTKFQSLKLSSMDTKFYRVYASERYDVLVASNASVTVSAGGDVQEVDISNLYTTDTYDWFDQLGLSYLLDKVDEATSLVIMFAFFALPLFGIILMTILAGLALICDIKVVQVFCDKVIDPIYILTVGRRNVHTWRFKTVWWKLTIAYLIFVIMYNGNIIRILEWAFEWWALIQLWFKSLF